MSGMFSQALVLRQCLSAQNSITEGDIAPIGACFRNCGKGQNICLLPAVAKGAIQFPIEKAIPLALVKDIVRFRVKENAEKASAKGKRRTSASKK